MSQAGFYNNGVTPPPGTVLFLEGDTGGAIGPDGSGIIHTITDNAGNNSGSTVLISGNSGTNTLTLDITDVNNNTLIGNTVGNLTASGDQNVMLGSVSTGFNLSSGSSNSGLGSRVFVHLTTGSQNTAIGNGSLNAITTGSNNIGVGFEAGFNYITGTESSNIVIGNLGTNGESNIIRIGTQGSGAGQQNQAFMAGIFGNSPASAQMAIVNSSGQLGSQAIPASGIITLDGDSGSATGATVTISGGTTGITTTASGSTMDLTGTLNVGHGGTGNTSFTAFAVLCAGTTSTGAFQNVSGLGSAGNVLTSNGAGVLPSWQPVPSGSSITYTGDTGGALSPATNLNIITNVAANNSGATVLIAGSGSTLTLNVTDANSNTGIGKGSLNAVTGGGGTNNTALGQGSGSGITSGTFNTAVGYNAFANGVTSGTFNIGMGYFAGFNLTGGENSNVYLNSWGVSGESNTLRIGNGTTGSGNLQLNQTFIQGINGVTLGGTPSMVVIDPSTDQLGVAAIPGGSGSIIGFNPQGAGLNSAAGMRWAPPWAAAFNSVQAGAEGVMPLAGTIGNLFVNVTSNTSTTDATITINKNGVNTSIVVTIPALTAGVFSDTTHTASFAAGDLLQFEMQVTTVGNAIGNLSCSFS